jgi:hypothetical protein
VLESAIRAAGDSGETTSRDAFEVALLVCEAGRRFQAQPGFSIDADRRHALPDSEARLLCKSTRRKSYVRLLSGTAQVLLGKMR